MRVLNKNIYFKIRIFDAKHYLFQRHVKFLYVLLAI